MRARYKWWVMLSALVALLFLTIFSFRSNSPSTARAIAMTVLGYTNPAGSHVRFAVFAVSNQAPYAVRWRGDWVEVEGTPYHKARIVNSSLPGFTYSPVLKMGESLRLAVGEPSDLAETGRWRFSMSFSRYSAPERWLDFSFRHKLPLRLGPLVLVDEQRILNPSNHVNVSSVWLTK